MPATSRFCEPTADGRVLLDPQLDIFGTKFFPKLPATAALPTGGISVNWHQDNFAFGADVQADRLGLAKRARLD